MIVEIATDAATEESINCFDGYALDDRTIVVNVARLGAERSGGGPPRYYIEAEIRLKLH